MIARLNPVLQQLLTYPYIGVFKIIGSSKVNQHPERHPKKQSPRKSVFFKGFRNSVVAPAGQLNNTSITAYIFLWLIHVRNPVTKWTPPQTYINIQKHKKSDTQSDTHSHTPILISVCLLKKNFKGKTSFLQPSWRFSKDGPSMVIQHKKTIWQTLASI